MADSARRNYDYPPLLVSGRFPNLYLGSPVGAQAWQVKLVDGADRALLEEKQVDVILSVPPDFCSRLEEGGRPVLQLATACWGDCSSYPHDC